MKLLVFPEARRAQVEAAIADAFGPHHGGTGELTLTLTVTRLAATRDWAVHVTGARDEVLAASYCDVIRDALRRSE